ncbi:MAG TPA: EF-hand domain-containing protein [Bauldia sp.]|nr:EF-hand domain-containing protein [Bauldia sp.]
MSPKLLFAAAAAFAASAASLPAVAAPGDQPAQNERPAPLRAQIMFNLIDTNGDGAIDATEAAALQKAIFSALDANKDGKLTPDEFRKVAADFGGRNGGPRGPGMRGPGMRGPGMFGPPGWHRGPGPDGQRQGALPDDQQPGPGGPQQLGQNDDQQQPGDAAPPKPLDFASLDKNGDGVVTPDEFAAGGVPLPGMPPVK